MRRRRWQDNIKIHVKKMRWEDVLLAPKEGLGSVDFPSFTLLFTSGVSSRT